MADEQTNPSPASAEPTTEPTAEPKAPRTGTSRAAPKASGPVQFTTLNRWRRERSMLEVFLVNGQRLVGRIRSFDRFSMLLDMPQGGCFVFHHTVSTVQPAGKSNTRRPARPSDRPARPTDRPVSRPPRESGLDEGASPRDPAQPKSYASNVGSGRGQQMPAEPARRPGPSSPAPVVKVEKRKRRTIQRDPDES